MDGSKLKRITIEVSSATASRMRGVTKWQAEAWSQSVRIEANPTDKAHVLAVAQAWRQLDDQLKGFVNA